MKLINTKFICLALFIFSFGLLHSQEIDPAYVDSLKSESRARFDINNPKETFDLLATIEAYSIKNNYPKGLFMAYGDKGIFYLFMGSMDSARLNFKKALKIAEENNFEKSTAKVKSNLGVLEDNIGNYNEAIKWYLASIKVSEQLNDSIQAGKTYGNLAQVYGRFEDIELQEYYIQKGINILPENTQDKGILLTDLASLYETKGDYPAVLETAKKAETISTLIKSDRLSFFVNRLFGQYYIANEQPKTALDHFEKSYSFIKNQSYYYVIELNHYISKCHLELGDIKEAEAYLNQAIEGKTQYEIPVDLEIAILENLARIKNELSPSDVYHIQNEIFALKDSLYQTEKIALSKELSVAFETEKKDKELAENALDIEKKESQLWLTLGVAGSLLALCLLLILLYSLNKQKHKVKLLSLEKENDLAKLEGLLQGEDKERSRVAKELHDGINGDLSAIKIQLSSLPIINFSKTESTLFNQSIDMIDNACEVIRSISHNLAPPAIKDFGWLEAVERFCNKMDSNYPEQVIFQSYGDALQFSETSQAHLYRIVQELVHNTLKHAKATEVLVQVNVNGSLNLIVEDDGIGYDKTKKFEGIGLRNIRARVEYLDGTWEVESSDKGTSHTLKFNLKALS